MQKPVALVGLGLVLFLVFLVVLWPARVAVGWLVPGGAELTGVSGTVWDGSAGHVRVGIMDVGRLKWDAHAASFLIGRPKWDLKAERPDGFVSATVTVRGTRGVEARDLRIAAELSSLSGWIELAGTDGNLSVSISEFALGESGMTRLAGQVVLDSIRPMGLRDVDLGTIQIDIPAGQSGPFVGTVTVVSGPLRIEQGRVEVQAGGSYVVEGLVGPQPGAPEQIVQGLQFLGQADSQGMRRFSQAGSL
jgi:general secretion pathway protein N